MLSVYVCYDKGQHSGRRQLTKLTMGACSRRKSQHHQYLQNYLFSILLQILFFMCVCCFLLNFLLRILPRLPSIFVVDDLPHCGSLLLAHVPGMRFDSSLDKLFLCINNVNRCYTDRKLTIPIHFTLKYITFRPTAWHSIKLHSISIFVYLDDVF